MTKDNHKTHMQAYFKGSKSPNFITKIEHFNVTKLNMASYSIPIKYFQNT